jgi:molybdate transport system ATP-binding protein
MTEIERLADNVVLLEKGHLVASGKLSELQSNPSLPLATSREAAVTLEGVVTACDPKFGLSSVSVPGAVLIAPPPPATSAVGESRRLRILASDVSLAHERPTSSSILNVLPARVLTMRPLDRYEVLVIVALGDQCDGSRLLSRMTLKSWTELALAEGQNVYAQVKYVSLNPGRGESEEQKLGP